MDLKLVGNVYLQKVDGTQLAAPGCTVRHVYQSCCPQQKAQTPMGACKSARDGSYSIMFSSPPRRYTHAIRCDYAGKVAATRQFIALDIDFSQFNMEAVHDFVFVEAAQASHPCGGACSTKSTPCGRNTTNKEHCYQHVDQDTGIICA